MAEMGDYEQQFIRALYEDLRWMMMRRATKHYGDPDLAEEVVQAALVTACEKVADALTSDNPRRWMMAILKFKIMEADRARKKINQHEQCGVECLPGVQVDDYHRAEFSDLVDTESFELIEKTGVQGFTAREAAEAFGITEEACKKRKQRTLKEMKRKLKEK